MVRSRRESHHSDGITDPNNLQQISATKSAQSGHSTTEFQCPLSGGKADITRWAEERGSAQMRDRASLCPLVKRCKGKRVTSAQAHACYLRLMLTVSSDKGGAVKSLPTRRSLGPRVTPRTGATVPPAGHVRQAPSHFQLLELTRYNGLS